MRDNPVCHEVIYNVCICRWLTTGVQREDTPSVEENDTLLLLNLENRTNFGKGTKDNTHRSRRVLVDDISDRRRTVYKQDENGCYHDDQFFWQSECNGVYLTKKFRDGLKARNQHNKLINETCYLCNAMIVKPSPVPDYGENDHLV